MHYTYMCIFSYVLCVFFSLPPSFLHFFVIRFLIKFIVSLNILLMIRKLSVIFCFTPPFLEPQPEFHPTQTQFSEMNVSHCVPQQVTIEKLLLVDATTVMYYNMLDFHSRHKQQQNAKLYILATAMAIQYSLDIATSCIHGSASRRVCTSDLLQYNTSLIYSNCTYHICLFISVIIPFLMEAAEANNSAPNETQRRDIATILLGAYKSLSGCCILVNTSPYTLRHSLVTRKIALVSYGMFLSAQSNVSQIIKSIHNYCALNND